MRVLSKEQILEALNHDLVAELSAVEIYRAHADAIAEDAIVQGVRSILSVEEERAEELTKRTKDLGGEPAQPGGVPTLARPGSGRGQRSVQHSRDAQAGTGGGAAGHQGLQRPVWRYPGGPRDRHPFGEAPPR